MKRFKNFESFINEELSPDTYKSAAEKLKEKGHKKRSENIEKHSKSMVKNVKPVTFEMYGEEHTIDHSNVIEIMDKDQNDMSFGIDFKGNIKDIKFDDMTEEEIEEIETDSVLKYFHFYKGKKYDFESDGLIIPDRRNALKLLKFIKEYFSYYGGPIEKEVNKLTVNDLYEE